MLRAKTQERKSGLPKPIRQMGETVKSKLMGLVSKTFAWGAGTLRRDVGKNALWQKADNVAPDEKVPRDLPNHGALFANGGLNRPLWGLLRVEDVIR
jgi:hypothetical protein